MQKSVIILIEDAGELLYNEIIALVQKSHYSIKIMSKKLNEQIIVYPGFRIERYGHRVYMDNTEVKLSAFEFKLLFQLASSPKRVFTKEQIYQNLYNEETGKDTDNSIYYLVKSLRKKLNDSPTEPKYIRTVRGVGYQFCGGEL